METIRERLEPLLREHGINRAAEESGINASVISEWLAGKRGRKMNEEQLQALATVVGRKLTITWRLGYVSAKSKSR